MKHLFSHSEHPQFILYSIWLVRQWKTKTSNFIFNCPHTFCIDSWQGEKSIGDSGFSCFTFIGGGDAATGSVTPWELWLLFNTGSSFGIAGGTTGSDVSWVLLLLFKTGSSLGTFGGGTTGSTVLVGEVAPEEKGKW